MWPMPWRRLVPLCAIVTATTCATFDTASERSRAGVEVIRQARNVCATYWPAREQLVGITPADVKAELDAWCPALIERVATPESDAGAP